MLPKEDREIISKIGRYKYNKMKELNMSLEEFEEHERKIKAERKLKEKIGDRDYNKMKQLGLNYEEYKQYQKEQKFKKYEKKREKDKIRFRTVRYIERYCNLEMKCQECGTKKEVQIHHPNYKDYLKINLLCREHHTALHNFELVPPEIIDLEQIKSREPPRKEMQQYIEDKLQEIKQDILSGKYNYSTLSDKYKISTGMIKRRLEKEADWNVLEEKLKSASIILDKKTKHKNNPIQKYRIENKLSVKQLSELTGIKEPTIRKIECEMTNINNIRFTTQRKLQRLGINF